MGAEQKPVPVAVDEDKPYWDAIKEHKFVLQHCRKCGLYSSQPRIICPRCLTEDFEWKAPSGKGKIHSYTIIYQTFTPGFEGDIPYIICHAAIDEEPTCYITANLLGVAEADFDKLTIDLPVVIEFEDRPNGSTVPQWRLAK